MRRRSAHASDPVAGPGLDGRVEREVTRQGIEIEAEVAMVPVRGRDGETAGTGPGRSLTGDRRRPKENAGGGEGCTL